MGEIELVDMVSWRFAVLHGEDEPMPLRLA